MMKWAMLLCATLATIACAAGVDDRLFLAAVIFDAAFAICREIEKTRMEVTMMPETVNVKDLLRVCEGAADTAHKLYMGLMDSGRVSDSDFAAIAYFHQQEQVYRYLIPGVINTLVEQLEKEGGSDA